MKLLHFSEARQSSILKMEVADMENIPRISLARVLRAERPDMALSTSLFVAELLQEVHRLAILRAKIVK